MTGTEHGTPGPGTPVAPPSTTAPAGAAARGRRRYRVAAVAGAALLAGVVVAGALTDRSPGPDAPPVPAAGPVGEPPAADRGATPAQDPAPRVMAERETCDDGRDPAESYRPSTADGEAVRRIQENGELVVGVDQNSYLWGFRAADTGDIVGFDIDLSRAIAEALLGEDARIVYKAIPTAEREKLIAAREVDMVVRTVSITCARWDSVAFSTGYFRTGQQLLAPRDSPIEGFDASLDGARVCGGEDTTAQALLEREGRGLGAELVTAASHLDCLVLIQLGEADALMTDGALAAGHAAQDPAMRLVGEPLTEEYYGVAMHPEDVDLVRRVNAVLAGFTDGGAGGAWRQSYDEWLAEHMDEASPEPPDARYRD